MFEHPKWSGLQAVQLLVLNQLLVGGGGVVHPVSNASQQNRAVCFISGKVCCLRLPGTANSTIPCTASTFTWEISFAI